jgi:DNA-directed RNA polymerase subunit beta
MTESILPVKIFGRYPSIVELPNLVEIQTGAWTEFLAKDVPQANRESVGMQRLLSEIFPIYSYDKTMCLEYVGYELGRPRYTIDECRKLRLTFGHPLKVRLRLIKPEPIEEEVYLGEIPIMIGGGEFIVNGSERVIVSQLHRSPGVDFSYEQASASDTRKLHSCWIIPERGSWVELNVTKKEILTVRIDQSGKFSAITLLRALDERLSTDRDLLREFYQTKVVKKTPSKTENAFAKQITDKIAVGDVIVLKTGEVLVPSGEIISESVALEIAASGLAEVEVLASNVDDLDLLIINSMREDPTKSYEEALLKIYSRLRPGNPVQLEKARELFHEKFFDEQRYRLGRVGRFRLNRKFSQLIHEDTQVLQAEDIINSVKYLLGLRRRRNRRHRQPRQPARPHHRRASRGGVPQGPAQATPHRPGAHEPGEPRDGLPAHPDQLEDLLERCRLLLRAQRAVAGRRPGQSALPTDPRASPVGPRSGWSEPQARRLRRARRALVSLRSPVSDRDPRGVEHRPDLEPGPLLEAR